MCVQAAMLMLGYAQSYKEHPIKELYENGVSVTINTDDLLIFDSKIQRSDRLTLERNIEIVMDSEKKKIVRIYNNRFKGKRSIDWRQVREYLKDYVGMAYEIVETKEIIYIGSDLPDEYSGSRYTYKLMGTLAKAKANAVQGIPELLETAVNKRFLENCDPRHIRNAQYGWYRYDAYFELPVYDEDGEIERYNRNRATMLIRHLADGKKYLYDILNIKKKRATLSAHNELTRHKTHFSLIET